MHEKVDAFYADHPEIFHVNFDNLSFSVKMNNEDKYLLSIGTGRTLSYARHGFETEGKIAAADKVFIWRSLEGMAPCVSGKPIDAQQPPAEG